ncbi:MAG: transposase [Acidobacteria bacterium]|nr:transposase [Acidobacteriota bacterium]
MRLRWPDGFRCPRCGGAKASLVRDTLFQCSACRHQTSGRDHFPRHTRTPDHVVSGYVVCDQPKERGRRFGDTKDAGLRELPDCLALVTEVAACDGQAGS